MAVPAQRPTRRRRAARIVVIMAATAALLLVGGLMAMSATAERPVRLTTVPANAVVIGIVPDGNVGPSLPNDADLIGGASDPFVVFRVRGVANQPGMAEWCLHGADDRMITLRHIMSCRDEVRILRPSQIDCGEAGDGANADEIARAIMAKPALHAVDRGVVRAGADVPMALFAAPVAGRVIDIPGGPPRGHVAGNTCRFIVDVSGDRAIAAGDPPPPPVSIDVDGDVRQRLIVVDAPRGPVIIRALVHDASDDGTIGHMLGNLYAIRFL